MALPVLGAILARILASGGAGVAASRFAGATGMVQSAARFGPTVQLAESLNRRQVEADRKKMEDAGNADRNDQLLKIRNMTAGVTGATQALLHVPFAVKSFNDSLLATMEPLRRFNGQINMAFAKLKQQDIIRQQKFAGATAGSTSFLASQTNDLKDALLPLEELAANIKNYIGGAVAWIVKIAVQMNPIYQGIKWFQENWPWGDKPNKNDLGNDWLNRLNDISNQRQVGPFNNGPQPPNPVPGGGRR